MRKETIKTLQGDCHENEKNNEIGGPNNSIKKRNERIIEAYQTKNTPIAGLAERFGVSKRTIGNVTHSLKEQNLQQQSLTNETTKEKEDSNNQNIEAYLAGELWLSKLVNRFNGSARTILMKIKKVREQKEEMQYKSHVLHEVEEYSPKLSQISKQIHTTENEHLIDENQQDILQGIGPQQNKNFSSSLPLPNKVEEATSSENHIFNSKQVQVTGSHLRENQEEHPILSETEGEFENSLLDSLSDFDYSNESNEERLFFQKSANLSDELSNHNLTTDEIVEALMEFDETLDSAKNLVDYVNGSNELPKQSNNDLFEDLSNDSLMTEEITEILMRFNETLNSGKKPMKYVMGLSERQESDNLSDELSNHNFTTENEASMSSLNIPEHEGR